MTNTKKLRKFFGYTQDQLAKLLGVSRSTVAMWETTQQEPDYETLKRISMIFDVSSDFVMGEGIFSKWDQIIEYYDDVSYALIQLIPPELKMPSFSEDRYLSVWLDTRLYSEPDELQLARWFSFAVKYIHITPTGHSLDGQKTADVEIVFTPEFEALIQAEKTSKRKPASASADGLTDIDIRRAMWFRSLHPETQKAILTLGGAPEDLVD